MSGEDAAAPKGKGNGDEEAELTLEAMHEFGVDIASTRSLPPHYLIPGSSRYQRAMSK